MPLLRSFRRTRIPAKLQRWRSYGAGRRRGTRLPNTIDLESADRPVGGQGPEHSRSSQNAILRYSRLQVCVTGRRILSCALEGRAGKSALDIAEKLKRQSLP